MKQTRWDGLGMFAVSALAAAFVGLLGSTLVTAPEIEAQSTWRMPVKSGLTTGSLIYASSRANFGAVDAVAAGQVLASAGTGTKPAYSASPTLTTVTLSGLTASTAVCVDSNKLTASCAAISPTFTNLTATGTLQVDGNATLGNATTDAHGTIGTFYYRRKVTSTSGAGPVVLTSADCDSVQIQTASSGTTTYTLPSVTGLSGCQITFIAGHASGEILINSAAAATCVITTFAAVGADADTGIVTDASCDTGLKNTAATNAIGDSLTLVTDGTSWYGVGITSGIWASQ